MAKSHKQGKESLLPAALQRSVAQAAAKADMKGRKLGNKRKAESSGAHSSDLWNFAQKESTKQKALSEHEERATMDNLRLSARAFNQTSVIWRTKEDLADLMGNHNSCMRAVTRAKTSPELRPLFDCTSPTASMSTKRMRDRADAELQLTKQAQQIRELHYRLVPALKPGHGKDTSLLSLAPPARTGMASHSKGHLAGAFGHVDNTVNELSLFAEDVFDADYHRFFRALDSNCSGSISLNEFIVSLQTLHFIDNTKIGRQTEDVKQLFKFLDHDGGGAITVKEFRETFGERLEARRRAAMEGDAHANPAIVELVFLMADTFSGDLPTAFEAIDQDGSGRLKEHEWIAGLKAVKFINEKVPGRGVADAAEVFHLIDDNGGGSISLREYQGYFGPKLLERRRRLGIDDEPKISGDLVEDLRGAARSSFFRRGKKEDAFFGAEATLHADTWKQ